jgi:hypothetical protein
LYLVSTFVAETPKLVVAAAEVTRENRVRHLGAYYTVVIETMPGTEVYVLNSTQNNSRKFVLKYVPIVVRPRNPIMPISSEMAPAMPTGLEVQRERK